MPQTGWPEHAPLPEHPFQRVLGERLVADVTTDHGVRQHLRGADDGRACVVATLHERRQLQIVPAKLQGAGGGTVLAWHGGKGGGARVQGADRHRRLWRDGEPDAVHKHYVRRRIRQHVLGRIAVDQGPHGGIGQRLLERIHDQGRSGLQVRPEPAGQRTGVSNGRRAECKIQVPPGFEELELRFGSDALAKRALGAEHDEMVVRPVLDPPQRRGVIRGRRRGDVEAH
mmetsp:Transcript_9657/g.26254  ORF Transcript_9657/g.26254 Transcript_9657/m.26254 type:complete len:228 (-) Transcript_9657:202-885(-)